MGPSPGEGYISQDLAWQKSYLNALLSAARRPRAELEEIRKRMKAAARKRFSWRAVAEGWKTMFGSPGAVGGGVQGRIDSVEEAREGVRVGYSKSQERAGQVAQAAHVVHTVQPAPPGQARFLGDVVPGLAEGEVATWGRARALPSVGAADAQGGGRRIRRAARGGAAGSRAVDGKVVGGRVAASEAGGGLAASSRMVFLEVDISESAMEGGAMEGGAMEAGAAGRDGNPSAESWQQQMAAQRVARTDGESAASAVRGKASLLHEAMVQHRFEREELEQRVELLEARSSELLRVLSRPEQ